MTSFENPNGALLITLKEAAARLSLSTRTLHREIAAGRFPRPVKIGRSTRVPLVALQTYVRSLSGGAQT
ncbi:helix-turn-helix transcriptional regulator [Horticoccus sp. 23ND18S-11]|uniref:helix-turn-helix transcriptional regulator n=1 Tax=Horticoccus sp. 23ND18S-11 TaxID=3391832 RepID=UPI0039C8C4E9